MNARRVIGGCLGAAVVATTLVVVAAPTRAGTGDLTFDRCFGGDTGCIVSTGLGDAPAKVALTPDGKQLYATNGRVLAVFDRNTSNGELRFRTCFGGDRCNTARGLDGAGAADLAVSPDGRFVYASTGCCTAVVVDGKNVESGNSIVIFRREPATNAVSFQACVRDSNFQANGCTQSAFLENPNGLDVSDDGKHLYVAAGERLGTAPNRGVTQFARDAATGAIEFRGCTHDSTRPLSGPCNGATGIGNARAVDVSADGKSVHVAATNTLLTLTRNTTTGLTSFLNCIGQKINASDRNTSGPSPCPLKVDGLSGVTDVKVSDDDKSVYTSAFAGSAIGFFRRASSNGTTTFDSCFRDVGLSSSGCVATPGLKSPVALDASKDGQSVYAAGTNTLVTFFRDRNTGQLAFDNCHQQPEQRTAVVCGQTARGLSGAFDVVVSDDVAGSGPVGGVGGPAAGASGTSVYVTATTKRTLTHFFRETPRPVAQGLVAPEPPDTDIGAGPAGKIAKRAATFFFSSDPGTTFECSLDGADFGPCTSPTTVTGLKPGAHTFQVVAIDDSGRRDASPALWEFTVKKKRRR